jgi:hypothetical protein
MDNKSAFVSSRVEPCRILTHLQFDLGLSDILLASVAAGDLLSLGDTSTDSISAEVLQRVGLGGVDAQDGVGLDRSKATGHYMIVSSLVLLSVMQSQIRRGYINARKNCLAAPLSSTTSTKPGLSCSMEGTWLARIPMSPDSAGMLTWTTSWDL